MAFWQRRRPVIQARKSRASGGRPHVAAVSVERLEPRKMLSADGLIIFTTNRTGNAEIFSVNPDGTNLKNLTNNPAADGAPMVNSAGTRVTFASNRDGNLEIYVMNVDGTGLKNISKNSGYDYDPAPSEDGTKVAWVSGRSGPGNEIWVADIDGTNAHAVTHGTSDSNPNWSADGTKIVFASLRDNNGGEEIYVMNADGTGVQRLTYSPGRDFYPVFNPDGDEIYFTSERDGNQEIYEMEIDGSEQENITNNPAMDSLPYYSPDGTRISFISSRDGLTDIYIMDPEAPDTSIVRVTNDAAIDAYPGWSIDPAYSALPTVSLSLSANTLAEAGGKTTLRATLNKPAAQAVTVALTFTGTATNLTDYSRSANNIIIPAGSLTGSVVLTAVQDAIHEASESIVVNIASATYAFTSLSGVTATILDDDPAPNTKPTISDIPNKTIYEDGTTGLIGFVVGDAETPAANLTLAATSANPTLVPRANIKLGGSGANRTVQVTPAANQFGTAVIYVQVSDGTAVATDSFTLTVLPVNDPPVMQSIGTKTVTAGSKLQFTVSATDVETPSASLSYSATGLPKGATFASRVFTWTPGTGQIGSYSVKFSVSDGQSTVSQTVSIVVTTPVSTFTALKQTAESSSAFVTLPGGTFQTANLNLPVTNVSPYSSSASGGSTSSKLGSTSIPVSMTRLGSSTPPSQDSSSANVAAIDRIWTGFGTTGTLLSHS